MEFKENRNPFTISGYLGRKWYFSLGVIIALISGILQFAICKTLFKEIMQLAAAGKSYCIFDILTSGILSQNSLIAYVIIFIISLILSFINNKKRLTDLLGRENPAYILSAAVTALTGTAMFLNSESGLYNLLYVILLTLSFILLFAKGKLDIPVYEEPLKTDGNGFIEAKTVVSFWKRWFAYIIDACGILASISLLALKICPDFITKLGDFSILIGYAIFVLYFGIMNSEKCKGQTLAKSVLKIKTVDASGQYLSLKKSLLRALVFTFCVMLPFAFLQLVSIKDLNSFETIILILCITAGAVFNLLFLFNFKTRQTIHDLVAKSYVVTTKCNSPLKNNNINPTPIVFSILIALCYGMLMALGLLSTKLLKIDSEFIQKTEKDLNIKITKNTSIKKYPSEKPTGTIYIPAKDIDNAELANNTAAYIIKNAPTKFETINVVLYRFATFGNVTILKNKSYTQKAEETLDK